MIIKFSLRLLVLVVQTQVAIISFSLVVDSNNGFLKEGVFIERFLAEIAETLNLDSGFGPDFDFEEIENLKADNTVEKMPDMEPELNKHSSVFYNRLRNKTKLTQALLPKLKYNKFYRANKRTLVWVKISMRSIVRVSRQTRGILLDFWNQLEWNDPFFAWDPAEYHGVEIIALDRDDVWYPDLIIANSKSERIIPRLLHPFMTVNYKGDFFYLYPLLQDISCQISFEYFPFDEQVCDVNITSNSLPLDVIDLNITEANSGVYNTNSEWALIDFIAFRSTETNRHFCEGCEFAILTFRITIRRRATMPFFYFYLPNIIINIQAFIQFLLPCDSMERMKWGASLYLGVTFYLQIIEDVISQSLSIPVWVIYIALTAVLAGIAQVVTIYTLFFHFNGCHDNFRVLPRWARQIALHKVAKVLGMRKMVIPDELREKAMKGSTETVTLVPDSYEDEESKVGFISGGQGRGSVWNIRNPFAGGRYISESIDSMIYRVLKHCEKAEERAIDERRIKVLRDEWKQFAMILDRACLLLYTTMTISAWLFIFIQIPVYHGDYHCIEYKTC